MLGVVFIYCNNTFLIIWFLEVLILLQYFPTSLSYYILWFLRRQIIKILQCFARFLLQLAVYPTSPPTPLLIKSSHCHLFAHIIPLTFFFCWTIYPPHYPLLCSLYPLQSISALFTQKKTILNSDSLITKLFLHKFELLFYIN